MTYGSWQIVGGDFRELPLGTTVGDALRRLVRERFKGHTAKKIEDRWGLDARTARNVVSQGNVSERTLTKAALAERWELWAALGEELFGQSYEAWQEERLKTIIEEAERDLDRVRRLRPQAAPLHAGAVDQRSAAVLESREGDEPARSGDGGRAVRNAGSATEGPRERLNAKTGSGRS